MQGSFFRIGNFAIKSRGILKDLHLLLLLLREFINLRGWEASLINEHYVVIYGLPILFIIHIRPFLMEGEEVQESFDSIKRMNE